MTAFSPLERAAIAAATHRQPRPPEPEALVPPTPRPELWRLVPRKFKALRRMLGEPPSAARYKKATTR